MKLTTPATASEPYTDDAPPVKTSTLFNNKAGTWLMSAQLPPFAVPGAILLPLIRTKVLEQPKFLRFAVAVPFDPFAVWAIWPGANCGKSFKTSSIRIAPLLSISSAVTTWTCDVLTIFGLVIRVPVITTSSTSSIDSSWANPLNENIKGNINKYLNFIYSPNKM